MLGVFRRRGLTAVPESAEGMEALLAIKDDTLFMADIRGARNPLQHKLFWKLCTAVADADDDDKENVKKWLLRQLNYIDVSFDPDGTMHIETKSIAFEKMEQAVFARLFNASIPLMSERLGSATDDFVRHFNELLDPECRALFKRMRTLRSSPPLVPDEVDEERADEAALALIGRAKEEPRK